MSDLQELTNELMADEEFRREYEAIQPELDITRAILDAKIRAGITPAQLAFIRTPPAFGCSGNTPGKADS